MHILLTQMFSRIQLRVLLLFCLIFCANGVAHAGDLAACKKAIAPAVKAINEAIDYQQSLVPKLKNWGSDQVKVGSCASRLDKLVGNPLCCKVSGNVAPLWEEISCLKLKRYYLRQACQCGTDGGYSTDEAIQDEMLEMVAAAKKLQMKAIQKGIKNPIIQGFVKEMTRSVNCINQNTIETFRDTMKQIDRLVSGEF